MVKNMNSEVSPPILRPGLIIYQLMASSKLLNLFVISTSHKKKKKKTLKRTKASVNKVV